MSKKLHNRYNPRQGKENRTFGMLNRDFSSLEKYNGDRSELAEYCSKYKVHKPQDWMYERINYSEANTNYAINTLKTYSLSKVEIDVNIASYCGLYVLNHADKLGYSCIDQKVCVPMNGCKIYFSVKDGIRCVKDCDPCDDECSSGAWIIFLPFLFLFLLVICAVAGRK